MIAPAVGRLALGAPGVYRTIDEPLRALTGVRMDVAGFVGVAPRGPARLPAFVAPWAEPPRGIGTSAPLRSVPVAVESWSEYRRLYGGFEGPGLLPYAVAAFFENGGQRAHVVRVVHEYGAGDPRNDEGTASGALVGVMPRAGGSARLLARSEGSWGNALRATLTFHPRPLAFSAATAAELTLPTDSAAGAGTLLRLWLPGGATELRFVSLTREEWSPAAPVRLRIATLESPLADVPERAEIVEADLHVADTGRDGLDRAERHDRLGLSPAHPRWIAAVLYRASALLYPDPAWIGDDLLVADATLRPPPPPPIPHFADGRDRYAAIVPDDFFDPDWVPADEERRSGVHSLLEADDLSVVVAPDLYSPGPLVAPEEVAEVVSLAGPTFASCADLAPLLTADAEGDGSDEELAGLRLDPAIPADLDRIAALQGQLVGLAEEMEQWVVLLDVPPGLSQREILAWRAGFGSAWAAAYHPWVRVARPDDARTPLVTVNPTGFAAGIVARAERAFGVPHGPANLGLVGAVSLADRVSPPRHDELHQAAVNVLLSERDGVRITAARTLSRDPRWRQLSVRRLVTLVRRTVLRRMQWAAFEPNDARLRDEVQRLLQGYLRQLHRAGAFRGRSPSESYFVRCDESLNPPHWVDEGRLLCQVGIAPAEPIEFIVLSLAREGDGTLLMEE